MGYNVSIKESTFKIPAKNLDTAYEVLCQLNFKIPNSHKRGHSYPDSNNAPEYGPCKSRWFSYMDWNYHETCKNAEEILQQSGFYTSIDEEGNLCIDDYDSWSGQEDLFLAALSPIATGYIIWEGEEGDVWGETYGGREVVTKRRSSPIYADLIDSPLVEEVTVEVVEDAAIAPGGPQRLLPGTAYH